jgi:hypothetical protein
MRNKFLIFYTVIIFLIVNTVKAETLQDLEQEINDIREELNSVSANSSIQDAVTIDKAVENLNSVIDFANQSVDKNEVKSAIDALELVESNISEVIKTLPKKFDVEVVEEIKSLDNEDLKQLSEISAATKINKINKEANFKENVLSLESKGLSTVEVTKNMVELGVGTLNAEQMLEDIKKAGSSVNYVNSAEYQAYTMSIKELNKQMTLDMNKSLNDLLKNSNFKSTAELAEIAAGQAKDSGSSIKSEVSSVASEAAGSASSAASEAASEMASEVQETLSQTAAETMVADIQEMGSEAYTQSQAYADQNAALMEQNRKAQEQLDKTLQELLDQNK